MAETGSTADTCRAALQVLQTARETMPFAIAYLTDEGGLPRRGSEYGLIPATDASGVTDPHAGVIDGVIISGRAEEVTGLRAGARECLPPGRWVLTRIRPWCCR